MQFTTIILSLATLAVAQETVWVTKTAIGTDCTPSATIPTAVPVTTSPSNTTTTAFSSSSRITISTSVSVGGNTTTGGAPDSPTESPNQPPSGSGAGAISPASGFALAGIIAAALAIIA
ncbi:hypothetical protein DRE_01221 [Drechslerella stenobrocha 248]|uniref:Uncharacterized protein n=1 Tax=Drechslerella stenobrocha 248 TaxID=1043628 RepID=W7I6H6_9PEZI|nr:hypothetical protein DRE_01221 [Drechslerella stenobrocha 248]